MIYSIATWISRVFHPFVVPIYALLIILVISPLGRVIPMTTQVAVWVSSIISAIVMPIATFATLKHFGVIKHKNLGHPDTAVQAGRPHGRVSLGSCPLQPVSPILTSVRKDRGLSSAHEPGQSQWGGPVSQETLHLGLVAQSRQPDR